MSKNFASIFHAIIITLFLLSLSGCGFKADPKYVDNSKEVIKK